MALYHAVFSVLDSEGRQSTFEAHTDAVDLANATTRFQGIAEAADAIILGRIVDVQISQSVDITGWTLKATNGGDRRYGGRFNFVTENGYSMRVTLPTFDPAKTVAGTDSINQADSAVFSFFDTAMIGGNASDYRGDDITSLRSAYEVHGGVR